MSLNAFFNMTQSVVLLMRVSINDKFEMVQWYILGLYIKRMGPSYNFQK